MEDIAESSEMIALFTDATGDNIAKAVVQARKLGLSFNDIAGSARKILDWDYEYSLEQGIKKTYAWISYQVYKSLVDEKEALHLEAV